MSTLKPMSRRTAVAKVATGAGALMVMGLAWGDQPGPRPDWERGIQRLVKGRFLVWARDPASGYEACAVVEHGDDLLRELQVCERLVQRRKEGREER